MYAYNIYNKMQKIHLLIFFTLFISLCSWGYSAELNTIESKTALTGLFWMCGLPRVLKRDLDFQNYLQGVEQNLQKNKYIDGLYIGIPWRCFELTENDFVFEKLDLLIELASENDKNFKIALMPGVYSPDFIYEKGSKKFITKDSNKHHKSFGEEVIIPLPWDKTYQKYFRRAVSKLAEHYRDNDKLVAVTVTGVNFMSAEMHLPHKKTDMLKWKSFNDYDVKIEQLWKNYIDFFAVQFPDQLIGLHLAKPLAGMDDEVDRVIKYAINKHKKKFFIQSCQLHGRNDNMNLFAYNMILKHKDNVVNGFQNLAGWKYAKSAARQGSFEQTIQNFKKAEAEYYEVWYGDGQNPELCQKIHETIWGQK